MDSLSIMRIRNPQSAIRNPQSEIKDMHRIDFSRAGVSRREMLCKCANGFGGLALAYLVADKIASAAALAERNPLAPRLPHYEPKARSVISLFMDGGPSQIDTFDPKPRLTAEHGQPFKMKMEPTQFDNNGNTLGCSWKFRQYGESGLPVSDLFPHVATCADELAVV